jgi:hypothetical protein
LASPLTTKPTDPLQPPGPDGRQSQAALEIARGAARLLVGHGFVCLPEVTLPNGRRADLMGISDKGALWIVEVKSSIADFRADQKWSEYQDYCDRLLFAVAPDFPLELLPEATGWIVADRFGADLIRTAPDLQLAPARRKVLTISFARAASARLMALADPDRRLG